MRCRFAKLMSFGLLAVLFVGISACQGGPTAAPPVEETSVTDTPYPTYTPYPTNTPYPTYTPVPTDTPTPEATEVLTEAVETPTETPTIETTEEATEEATEVVTAEPTEEATSAPATVEATEAAPATVEATEAPAPQTVSSGALEVRPDANVAPPLTVLVSTNTKSAKDRYRVSGVLRNDGSRNYVGLGVVATFYTSSDRRYGPIKVSCGCLVIAPGEQCPFVVEATSTDLVAVMLHPEGYPSDRGSAPINVEVTRHSRDGLGYVHIAGQVSNPHPFTVKNTTVTAALLDASGEIVAVDSVVVLDVIDPGASASFELAISPIAYSSYQLYAQAEPK